MRLPSGLRDRIKDVAERNGRSVNAEIVNTLLCAYPEPAVLLADLSIDEVVEMVSRDGISRRRESDRNTVTVIGEPDGSIQTSARFAAEVVLPLSAVRSESAVRSD